MKTKQVRLIPCVTDVHIHKSTDEQTEIAFKSKLYPNKTCIHIVSGEWEIEAVKGSLVTLVNHNEVIRHEKTNLP